jgi:predicted amidohydrolase YtcJ
MVILNDNIFDLKPEAICNVKVETTIVGGKAVLRRVRISR